MRRFDVMVGKHGDHVGGERDAVQALVAGEVDAACVIDGNQLVFAKEGTIAAGAVRVLDPHRALRPLHDDRARRRRPTPTVDRFVELLLSMSFDDPGRAAAARARRAAASGGPAAPTGYDQLEAAVDRLGFYGADGSILVEGYPR